MSTDNMTCAKSIQGTWKKVASAGHERDRHLTSLELSEDTFPLPQETKVCRACQLNKPIAAFQLVEGRWRANVCHACKHKKRKSSPDAWTKEKARLRRRAATRTRSARQAERRSAAERSGKIYRTHEEYLADCAKRKQARLAEKKRLRDLTPLTWRQAAFNYGRFLTKHGSDHLRAARREQRRREDIAWYRKRYADNPERERARVKIYKHANPDVVAAWNNTRAARASAQNDYTLNRRTLEILFELAERCPYCDHDFSVSVKTLDHRIPLSRGGLHSITNVDIICYDCNTRKSACTKEEFLQYLEAEAA